MTKPISEVKEEIISGVTTPQTIIALVCLLGFALTLDRPGQHLLFAAGTSSNTKHSDLWVNSAQVLTDVEAMEAIKLLNQGNIDDAIGEATKEVNERPTDIRAVICAGNVISQYGDKQKGFQYLKKSVDMAPQSRYVLLNYARRLAEGSRTQEAIDQYQLLCRTFPKQLEPHLELANLYMTTGKPKQAAEQYKLILSGNPSLVLVKKNYGLALAASGNEKEGFQSFVDACSVDKDEASYASAAKAILQANGNSAKRAISDMRIEVATKSKRVAPRITFAQLLLYLGKDKEAKDVAGEGLRVDSHNPELYMVLAEANLKLDDKDNALRSFKKAVNSLGTRQ